jgi:hypothetical protein
MIGLLIVLLVACVVFWAAQKLMAAFNIGDPIRTVVLVVLVLIIVLWIVGQLGGVSLGSWPRIGRF